MQFRKLNAFFGSTTLPFEREVLDLKEFIHCIQFSLCFTQAHVCLMLSAAEVQNIVDLCIFKNIRQTQKDFILITYVYTNVICLATSWLMYLILDVGTCSLSSK
jgi:hypothetical protein